MVLDFGSASQNQVNRHLSNLFNLSRRLIANMTHLVFLSYNYCNAILVRFMGRYNLNVRISQQEREIIDQYCAIVDRTQSDVIREFIRSLENKSQKSVLNNVK